MKFTPYSQREYAIGFCNLADSKEFVDAVLPTRVCSEIGSSADHMGLQNPLNWTPYSIVKYVLPSLRSRPKS